MLPAPLLQKLKRTGALLQRSCPQLSNELFMRRDDVFEILHSLRISNACEKRNPVGALANVETASEDDVVRPRLKHVTKSAAEFVVLVDLFEILIVMANHVLDEVDVVHLRTKPEDRAVGELAESAFLLGLPGVVNPLGGVVDPLVDSIALGLWDRILVAAILNAFKNAIVLWGHRLLSASKTKDTLSSITNSLVIGSTEVWEENVEV